MSSMCKNMDESSSTTSSVNLSRQEDADTLLKQEKHKIKDILKLNPKFDQEALKQTLGKVGASEQEDIVNYPTAKDRWASCFIIS